MPGYNLFKICYFLSPFQQISEVFIYHFFVDIDECATQTDECPDNSRCINTPGSYRCECWSGFTKIGEICEGKIWMNYLTMILTNN